MDWAFHTDVPSFSCRQNDDKGPIFYLRNAARRDSSNPRTHNYAIKQMVMEKECN